MLTKYRLYCPGPTPVPEDVLLACAQPQLHHRTPIFRQTLEEVTGLLKQVFRTERTVYTLTGSGTSAFEAGLISTMAPGRRALNVTNGKFSERWAAECKKYHLELDELRYDYGDHTTADEVRQQLEKQPADMLIVTHSETSTGAACDMKAVAEAAREVCPDILVLVDGITSIGALPFEMDEWGVDVAITGSQKALMMPPGLGFVALSERAEAAMDANDRDGMLYLDLKAYRKAYGNWDTPYTPNNQLIHALLPALKSITGEGMETVWKRTHANAEAVRAGMKALGLELFSSQPADSVSAIKLPAGMGDSDLRGPAKKLYNVHLAGGQGDMKGSLFRVNHMGYTDIFEAITAVSAVELVMKSAGQDVTLGTGVAAAQATFAETL